MKKCRPSQRVLIKSIPILLTMDDGIITTIDGQIDAEPKDPRAPSEWNLDIGPRSSGIPNRIQQSTEVHSDDQQTIDRIKNQSHRLDDQPRTRPHVRPPYTQILLRHSIAITAFFYFFITGLFFLRGNKTFLSPIVCESIVRQFPWGTTPVGHAHINSITPDTY